MKLWEIQSGSSNYNNVSIAKNLHVFRCYVYFLSPPSAKLSKTIQNRIKQTIQQQKSANRRLQLHTIH